jgi:hypothetical protein
MSIPCQHVLCCFMLSQIVLYAPTIHCICLHWSTCVLNGHWENGVLIRDSAGIRRVLYRTLFECCSDLPGECSGVLRRNAKKVRTKTVVIPAQDSMETGKYFGVFFGISENRVGGREPWTHGAPLTPPYVPTGIRRFVRIT